MSCPARADPQLQLLRAWFPTSGPLRRTAVLPGDEHDYRREIQGGELNQFLGISYGQGQGQARGTFGRECYCRTRVNAKKVGGGVEEFGRRHVPAMTGAAKQRREEDQRPKVEDKVTIRT
uniref:Uncharacterized protein n=1 Tax=Steinernema glaseri TaxID=37863 RepID=A0A1I7YYX3_9BILA